MPQEFRVSLFSSVRCLHNMRLYASQFELNCRCQDCYLPFIRSAFLDILSGLAVMVSLNKGSFRDSVSSVPPKLLIPNEFLS